jgi:hypothetical protein
MTSLIFAALGMVIGSAVLHFALAARRPFDRTYLSFAFIMVFVAAYLFYEHRLYVATSVDTAVEALRYQLVAAYGFIGCSLIFVPSYTRTRIPPAVMITCWLTLATLFILNLALPYGTWLSGRPQLVVSSFRSEVYTEVIAPPMGIVQYANAVLVFLVFAVTFASALVLIRRGERQRGAALAIALVIAVLHYVVDLIHDAVGGTWPYVAEFGLVAWGLIMAVQLALDYRTTEVRLIDTLHDLEQHTAELSSMVDAAVVVRDKLNTPLQTLELGLALYTGSPQHVTTLAELRDAVDELAALGRDVERTMQAQAKEPLP